MVSILQRLLRMVGEAVRDLAPVVLVIVFFQAVVLRQPFPDLSAVLAGLVFVILGLTMFVQGLQMGLFPLGEAMAEAFARKGSLSALLAFAFCLGVGTTVAEPALIAVADKAAQAAGEAGFIAPGEEARSDYALNLRLTVALAVGVALVLGVFRILKDWPSHYLVIGGYSAVVVLNYFAPPEIVGIAYDSGGVTTSTITVPLVTALGVGLAGTIRGRSPLVAGFGLIALASLTPIVFVLIFGMIV